MTFMGCDLRYGTGVMTMTADLSCQIGEVGIRCAAIFFRPLNRFILPLNA